MKSLLGSLWARDIASSCYVNARIRRVNVSLQTLTDCLDERGRTYDGNSITVVEVYTGSNEASIAFKANRQTLSARMSLY
jgi:hypothetical protein